MFFANKILEIIAKDTQVQFPSFTTEKRQELLETYHPDYSVLGKEVLTFGPNEGQLIPMELLNLILKSDDLPENLEEEETDLLIIGSGAAGISAALEAIDQGIQVTLITKDKLGASNTVLAQGGMAVALGMDDAPKTHSEDTLKAGKSNNPKLVEVMVNDARDIVQWLEKLGMNYDRDEKSQYQLLAGGGHSFKRVLTNRGFIGPRLMKILIGNLRTSKVKIQTFVQALDLICKDNQYLGAVVFDRKQERYRKIWSKGAIIATGGQGGLKPLGFSTSNHKTICGEGLAMAYRAGVPLVDMDSSQFHPTGVLWPEPIKGMLVSEGVRSIGGGLYNNLGLQFVNPLETRDVVTAAIIKEVIEGRGIMLPEGEVGVLLNSCALPEDVLRKTLGKIYKRLLANGYNPQSTPIIVGPTYHYQNGGLAIDHNGKTNIKGLWAAGEVTGGIHGKNRLGGNALTDAFVFGRRAGIDAGRYINRSID